jgi:putative ABC transport system permease protein
MTVLGVAVAIAVLIGVIGVVDSFFATIDSASAELTRSSANRLNVDLQTFTTVDDPRVQAIEQNPVVGRAEPNLRLGGTIRNDGKHLDVLLTLLSLDNGLWHPTIDHRVHASGPGIVLAEKAARDLHVSAGDTITLRHPKRGAGTSYSFVDSKVTVLGTNPIPTRVVAFMDRRDASLMGLEGITNTVSVEPARGVAVAKVERALFGTPLVASAQPVRAFTDTIRKEIEGVLGIFMVVEAAVLLLALLIAFNSASINADERARENATMLAFGLRTGTVLRMGVVESFVIGVLGTAVGLGTGWLLLDWLVSSLIPDTMPDLGLVTAISTTTVVTALVVGVVVVALAPVFTLRKLWRMDVPSTLRVME